ncbi:MAG: heat-inducible transcriptional repressor HrcA [Alphaproteobacteria bacterium]|nr:heat-inducible transcriptional repressor HrcA [Alphaproteobacteria bacterium]
MTIDKPSTVTELSDRSREVFRLIVETYVETGEAVGSRTLSRISGLDLSPATIRNVMADLQDAGLLYSPHTSAGRLPTDAGLKLFVNGILELGGLSSEDREDIEAMCAGAGRSVEEALSEATAALSGLSQCASIVLAPKHEAPLKHIEFVSLGAGRALVVMVSENGIVENRIIETPLGVPTASLVEAGNYLTRRLAGRTISEARAEILAEIEAQRVQLDSLASDLVERGMAHWSGGNLQQGYLIVRGQANLLGNIKALDDLEKVRDLFQALEAKETLERLLELTQAADGMQVFIGADNALFAHAGCSLVVAPFADSGEHIVGAIGVIGPTRMNYARIVPMVDYTSKLLRRVVG